MFQKSRLIRSLSHVKPTPTREQVATVDGKRSPRYLRAGWKNVNAICGRADGIDSRQRNAAKNRCPSDATRERHRRRARRNLLSSLRCAPKRARARALDFPRTLRTYVTAAELFQ